MIYYTIILKSGCFFSSPPSQNGRAADDQAGVEPDQMQGGLPAGELGAYGEGPLQEVR